MSRTNQMKVALTAVLVCAQGCVTNFSGAPRVEGGRAGCERKCAAEGLVMESLVFMGEYSTACVCDVPRRAATAGGGSTAAAAAAAAVMPQLEKPEDELCRRDDCGRFGD